MTSAYEYAQRRKRLMRRIGPRAVALIPSASERPQSRDVNWPFRQDSDFLYLTGFRGPNAMAVLIPGNPHGEFIMFCTPRDEMRERWEGPSAGLDEACRDYGANQAFPIEKIHEILPGLIEGRSKLVYTPGKFEVDAIVADLARTNNRSKVQPPHEFRLLDHDLHELRLFKSRTEISHMRHSARISAAAHRHAMARAQPGCHEYEIQAELLYIRQRQHMEYAYPDIVASGPNACILHYSDNTRQLKSGDLVLIDSGGMYQDYASDITRTWPIDGQFTAPQREIYELVLEAHDAAIKKCVVGNVYEDLHRSATRTLTRGLVHLGLLKGNWQHLWKAQAYRPFYIHQTTHWLGMDVHDVGAYVQAGESRPLRAGMVTTIEPGLYFAPEMKKVPKRFRGIGVRIEDDVLVTRAAPDILSADVPVDPDEICRLVGSAAR